MTQVKSVPSNISEICRLCLSEGSVTLPIFGGDDTGERSSVPLSFRILACVSVEVSPSDGLPTLICKRCLANINNWHDFKETCDSAQATLKEWQNVGATQACQEKELIVKPEPVEVGDETVDITQVSNSVDFTVYDIKEEEVEVVEHDAADDPLSLTMAESMGYRHVKNEKGNSDVELIFHLPVEEPVHLVADVNCGNEVFRAESSPIKVENLTEQTGTSTSQVYKRKVGKRKRLTTRKRRSKPKPVSSVFSNVMSSGSAKPFVCSLCDKGFSYNYLLKRHLVTHSREEILCSICKKAFSTKSDLETHLQIHAGSKQDVACLNPVILESNEASMVTESNNNPSLESPDSSFDCYICKSSFSTQCKLKLHMRIHSQFGCPKCGRVFNGGIALSNHLRSHSTKDVKRHSCGLCLKSFSNITALATHKKCHHNTKKIVSDGVNENLNSEVDANNESNTSVSIVVAERSASSSCSTNLVCKVCNKQVKNHSALTRHMVSHTKLKLYSCTVCKASMGYASSVHKHMKLIHGLVVDFKAIKPHMTLNPTMEATSSRLLPSNVGSKLPEQCQDVSKPSVAKKNYIFTKNYNCRFCHKIFPNKHMHATHLKLVHLGKKTYKCTACNKVFAYKSFLVRHSKVHVGEMMYTCHVCLKSFADEKTLNNHKGVHTRFRCYNCSLCNKSLNGLKAWEQHQRMHKRGIVYSCKLCGKKFMSKSELHQHRKTHNITLKIYSCAVCKNSYHSSSALSKHKKKHLHNHLKDSKGGLLVKNPFAKTETNFKVNHVCDLCNKSFSCASSLVKHKRLHLKKCPVSHQPETSASSKGNISCSVCSRQFNDYASLIIHKGWHTRRPESVTKEERTVNNCSVNLDSTKIVTYDCNVCKKTFTSNISLNKHLKIHSPDATEVKNEQPVAPTLNTKHTKLTKQHHTCSICTKHFHSEKALITHRGWHSRQVSPKKSSAEVNNQVSSFTERPTAREEERQHFCTVCNKSFCTAAALGKHKHFHTRSLLSSMKSKKVNPEDHHQKNNGAPNQTDRFMFQCDTCMKSFKCQEYLTIHTRVHTGEKPFTCDVCPQSYHRRSNLYKHKKTHASSFKGFSCAVCQKTFAFKKHFSQHMLVHDTRPQNMFPCSKCSKVFSRMDHFRQHEKTHFN